MITERPNLLASTEYESDAFADNILRLEVLADGASVLTSYNSKHEITAQSYHGLGKIGHA
jgi:hypothetical protein